MEKRKIDRDEFVKMYLAGESYSHMCKTFCISLDTLRKRVKKYELPPRRLPLVINIEAFRESYYSGLSSYKLAETFGICRSTVTRLVKELKLRESHNAMHRMECYAQI